MPFTNEHWQFRGAVTMTGQVSLPDGAVGDAAVGASANVAATKLEHQHAIRYAQADGSDVVAAIVPVLGFVMGILAPYVWAEGWLHAKLGAFLVLLVLLFLAARRNRRLVDALEAGDDDAAARHWRGYLVLRIVGLAAFVLIFVAVVFRF